MQYEVTTPAEYLNALDDDWRKEKLLALRLIITELAPELMETINYKMLGYSDGTDCALHLNAQKGYVSLYVGNIEKVDPEGTILKGVSQGKGCIRFKKSTSVTDSGIEFFLERYFDLWRSGWASGC